MTKHAELIARLEAAEVGDFLLDDMIDRAFKETSPGFIHRYVTTSLDAALALAARVLPKCRCIAERDNDGTGWACVRASEDADRFMADAKTPSLALCVAILKALEGE